MARGMACGYGCVPEGGHIPDEEAIILINRVLLLSNDPAATPETALHQLLQSGEVYQAAVAGGMLIALGIDPLARYKGEPR
ncbi:hypothetical protein BGM09_00705 [Streptomyces sp. CBMA29]|nr:hypothetical protein [Streptomyces sp. CBMA29]